MATAIFAREFTTLKKEKKSRLIVYLIFVKKKQLHFILDFKINIGKTTLFSIFFKYEMFC